MKKYEVHVARDGGWNVMQRDGEAWIQKMACHDNETAVDVAKLLNEAYELGKHDEAV